MRYFARIVTAVLLGAACLPAASLAQNAPGMAPPAAMQMGELPDVVELSERDVTGFIDLVGKLKRLGVEWDARTMGADPSAAQALAGRAKAMEIMAESGFDVDRLQSVGYSVALAMTALEQDMDEIRQQMAQMEQMKSQLSPEQWAMMTAGMGAAFQMMEQVQSQPEGNVKLVEGHRAELERALKD